MKCINCAHAVLEKMNEASYAQRMANAGFVECNSGHERWQSLGWERQCSEFQMASGSILISRKAWNGNLTLLK